MRDLLFLVITRRGIVRTTKQPPHLKPDEHAVKLAVEVDDAAFLRPVPTATVRLDAGHLTAGPPAVSVEPITPPSLNP